MNELGSDGGGEKRSRSRHIVKVEAVGPPGVR
jgi:hypothetical protein